MQLALLTFKKLKTQELVVFKKTVFFTMYFSFISLVYFLVSPNLVCPYGLFVQFYENMS